MARAQHTAQLIKRKRGGKSALFYKIKKRNFESFTKKAKASQKKAPKIFLPTLQANRSSLGNGFDRVKNKDLYCVFLSAAAAAGGVENVGKAPEKREQRDEARARASSHHNGEEKFAYESNKFSNQHNKTREEKL